MNRNELSEFYLSLLSGLNDEAMKQSRPLLVTILSLEAKERYPGLYRETRRAIAARCITKELKRRKIK